MRIGIHERYLDRYYKVSQVFPSNPQQFRIGFPKGWSRKPEGDYVLVHTGYTCQPASLKERVKKGALEYIGKCFQICDLYGLDAVNTHPGSGKLENLEWVLGALDIWRGVSEDAYRNIPLLLENDTQNGKKVGNLFDLFQMCEKYPCTGICLDTAHLWASKHIEHQLYQLPEVVKERFGKHIKCLHLNMPDANVAIGSGKDRHSCKFSEGAFDPEILWKWAETFSDIPIILEAGHWSDVSWVYQKANLPLSEDITACPVRASG